MPEKKKFPGLHAQRLQSKGGSTEREKAFVEQWEKENGPYEILKELFKVQCDKNDPQAVEVWSPLVYQAFAKFPIGDVTDRDRIIAATLIQWLGTNVGFDFVGQALLKAGYEYPKKRRNNTSAG